MALAQESRSVLMIYVEETKLGGIFNTEEDWNTIQEDLDDPWGLE